MTTILNHKRITTIDRRRFLTAAMAAGGLFFTQKGLFAQEVSLTPAQTEGPYYPDRLPLDRDNDLLIIGDNLTPAVGTVAWLSGRVLDRRGEPVRGAVVEIWQADNRGNYIHSQGIAQGSVRDANFQGYGRFQTASSGEYLFRTIKPGRYPGRVIHVHVKVTTPTGTSLTTQFYVEGETAGNDGVLNGVPAAQRSLVVKPWTVIPSSSIGALAANFDLVMNYTPSDTPTATRPTLISMAGIVNGATLHAGAVSGGWVTLQGTNLAPATRTWSSADINGNTLPQSLDGVSVRINGQAASVYYISPTQLNVLAPEITADGSAQVTVSNAAGMSDPVTVAVKRLMPGFFQYPNEYAAAARASDGAFIGPANLIEGVTTTPARPGDTILLFGTGFGPTTPETPIGQVVTTPAPTATPVKIRIHNEDAQVAFAGLASAGLYQFNITVPNLPDGDYPVTAEVDGVRTDKIVRLSIQSQSTAATTPPPPPQSAEPYKLLLAQIKQASVPSHPRASALIRGQSI